MASIDSGLTNGADLPVLVVDDNAIVRTSTTMALKSLGIDAEAAAECAVRPCRGRLLARRKIMGWPHGSVSVGTCRGRRLCGSAVGVVGLLAIVRSRLLELMYLRVLAWFPRYPRPVLGKQDRQGAGVEIDTRRQRPFALARGALAGRQCQCASAFGGQLHLQ